MLFVSLPVDILIKHHGEDSQDSIVQKNNLSQQGIKTQISNKSRGPKVDADSPKSNDNGEANQQEQKQSGSTKTPDHIGPLSELEQIFLSKKNVDADVVDAALPSIQTLRDNYDLYKSQILAKLSDPASNPELRILLIELLDENWSDSDVTSTVRNVFEKEGPSSWVRGYAAIALARHNVDIGDDIIGHYQVIEGEVKGLHALALGMLNRTDAGDLIAEDAQNSSIDSIRLTAIEVLGKMSCESHSHLELLEQIVLENGRTGIDDSGESNFRSEAIATRAVTSISQTADADASLLLEFASNESLTINVRIAAVDGFAAPHLLMTEEVKQELLLIEERLMASKMSNTCKVRFQRAVSRTMDSLH